MHVIAIVLAVIVGVFLAWLMFDSFFGDLDGFFECLRFWFTPNIISLFRGEYGDDRWAEMRLFFWIISAGIPAVGTYFGIMQWLG